MPDILTISSVSQFHEFVGLPSPAHPLISIMTDENEKVRESVDERLLTAKFSADLYAILFKNFSGSLGYGKTNYDFQEGSMIFFSPGQVLDAGSSLSMHHDSKNQDGWSLIFHPDLIRSSTLGKTIDQYSYFLYEVNEALHLSEKEQILVGDLVKKIKDEYSQNIDSHSHNLIVSNLELLLDYCKRFYDRQFYTRASVNKSLVSQFEKELKNYFNSDDLVDLGVPSVNYFGEKLNMSSNYLSDLLKKETGKSIKEYINVKIVAKAKTRLLTSDAPIREIAYGLGFEYPQSFTRLFKNSTGVSPNEYRKLN